MKKLHKHYKYGFQGQEVDNEIKGEGNSVNYKYRMHDVRIGRFFAVDPLTAKYPHYTPYSFSGNKVIHAVELEGLEEVIIIGGANLSSSESNSGEKDERGGASIETNFIANQVEDFGKKEGLSGLNVTVFTPEPADMSSSFFAIMNYLEENLDKGEELIIYGYSLGGVEALAISKLLKEKGFNVDLLITVDAAYSWASSVIDRTVPENVEENINYYQTKGSGIGSHGGPNKREGKTLSDLDGVYNIKKENTSHGDIDNLVKDDVVKDIKKELIKAK